MTKQITITNLVGTSPYDIYICTSAFTSCNYYSTITVGEIPYTITVPFPFLSYTSYGILAIDSNGCEIKQTINCS